jgi:hypothetical protein
VASSPIFADPRSDAWGFKLAAWLSGIAPVASLTTMTLAALAAFTDVLNADVTAPREIHGPIIPTEPAGAGPLVTDSSSPPSDCRNLLYRAMVAERLEGALFPVQIPPERSTAGRPERTECRALKSGSLRER